MSNTYVTKQEVVDAFDAFSVTVTADDIPDMLLYSSKEKLDKRVGKTWGLESEDTYYLDGNDRNVVFVPVVPIVSLSDVIVINKDTTETSYTLTGTDRQVWWDGNTGKIEIIRREGDILVGSRDQYSIFPQGVRNIKITGSFGEVASELVKLAQILILYRVLSITNPGKYKTDIVSEKISKYSYSRGAYSGSSILSFDEYIEGIIQDLKDADSLYLETI